jgi:NAD(P)-dependent dehydrogenase (short-subunit alcohol dehydrogenase family)
MATGLSIGVCGSLLYYVYRKQQKSRKKEMSGAAVPTTNRDPHCRFQNKVVLITGAAGDIGGATATAFAQEGANVILVDLPYTKDTLKKKCVALKEDGAIDTLFVLADITNIEDVKKMVKHSVNKFGQIDYFFNNAGVQGDILPLHEQQERNFELVMKVNIYGVFLGMKYVAKAMKESGQGGIIVNTASLAGFQGPPNMVAYAASKFAVVGMTKTAAKDLAPYGVRVCAIAPGILEGKMWDTQIRGRALCRKRLSGDSSEVTERELKEQEERMLNGTPMKRQGKLSEVASVVTFLCSDAASYLTGTTILIDGGRLP